MSVVLRLPSLFLLLGTNFWCLFFFIFYFLFQFLGAWKGRFFINDVGQIRDTEHRVTPKRDGAENRL